jgi:hypothetical protein
MATFGEKALVPTAPDDPLAARSLADAGRHPGDDLRYGPGVVELHLAQHATGRLQVIVGVDQPRDDRRSAQVLDAGRWSGQVADLGVADRDEPPIANRHGRRPGIGVINRVHGAVDENQIRGEHIGPARHGISCEAGMRRRPASPPLADGPGGTRGLYPAPGKFR